MMQIKMKAKKLTAKIVNAALSGVNITVDGTLNFVNSSMKFSDNMAGYFSPAPVGYEISGSIIACGQKVFDKSIQITQKVVNAWGNS